ncbi:MAG: hypothetical protein ACFB0C_10485 [Leptolyngbyaceae cyanobacterium]
MLIGNRDRDNLGCRRVGWGGGYAAGLGKKETVKFGLIYAVDELKRQRV